MVSLIIWGQAFILVIRCSETFIAYIYGVNGGRAKVKGDGILSVIPGAPLLLTQNIDIPLGVSKLYFKLICNRPCQWCYCRILRFCRQWWYIDSRWDYYNTSCLHVDQIKARCRHWNSSSWTSSICYQYRASSIDIQCESRKNRHILSVSCHLRMPLPIINIRAKHLRGSLSISRSQVAVPQHLLRTFNYLEPKLALVYQFFVLSTHRIAISSF